MFWGLLLVRNVKCFQLVTVEVALAVGIPAGNQGGRMSY